jgi:hypothetical protein
VTFKAAEDSRKLSLPQKPEDYKVGLPKGFKAPEGMTFEFNEADPLLTEARTWAQKNGLSQEAFEEGLALIAARDIGTAQGINEAKGAQIKDLGVNGPARVAAVTTWMDAKGYGDLKPMLVTSKIIATFEKLMRDVNGGAPFSQAHRETPADADKIPGIEKMSFKEARAAQDALAARQRQH